MKTVDVKEAQARLPEILEEAGRGEEVVIAAGDGAAFRLVPVVAPAPRPQFGSGRGLLLYMSDDFDAPLDDFADYMP